MKKTAYLLLLLVFLSFLFVGCNNKKGAINPEQAFLQMQEAYKADNFEKIYSLQSREAKRNLEAALLSYKKMPDSALEFVTKSFGVSVSDFKKLTPVDFKKLIVLNTRKILERFSSNNLNDVSMDFRKLKLDKIDKIGDTKAQLSFKNSKMSVDLVKENGFWFFAVPKDKAKK